MRPETSGDLEDSGAEELEGVILPQLEDEADLLLDAGPSPQNIAEVRESQAAKVDANFFNKFDDDFDESDMKPSA